MFSRLERFVCWGGKHLPKIEGLKIQDIKGIITKERRYKRGRKKYQQLMEDTVLVWNRRKDSS